MKRGLVILRTLLCILILPFYHVSEAQERKAPVRYKTIEDLLYYDQKSGVLTEYMRKRCRLDLYYPEQLPNFPTVVWFHGGGLTEGDEYIPNQLRNQKIAVAAADYRLFPNVMCPAYIEDAAAAVAWVFKNIHRYGGSPDRIFVSGHSAEGYLTKMVGLDKSWLAKYNIDANRIASLISVSGHAITHYTIREERDIPAERAIIDEFAPIYHARLDAPPVVLITGDRNMEFLGRYEENAYFMRMMKVAGHKKITLYELIGYDHDTMLHPSFSILLKHVRDIIDSAQ